VETIESEIGTIQRFALGLVGMLSLKSEHDKNVISVVEAMLAHNPFGITNKIRKQTSEDLKW
jgi:hypothetical protein